MCQAAYSLEKNNGPLPAWICRWSSQQLPCFWYCWWTVNQAILKEDRRRKFCTCAYRDFPTASRGLNTSVTSELAQNAVGEHGRWVEKKKKHNSEMRRWMKLCDRNFVKQHNQLFDKYVTGPWWRILSEVRFYKCKPERARLMKQAKEYKNYFVHYFGRQFNNLMKKGSAFRRSGHIDCYMLRAWYRFYSRVFNRELKVAP